MGIANVLRNVRQMGLFESLELTRDLFISLGAPELFHVAFLEFFLFPIPPDLVFIPLAVATPELAPIYVAIATAGSVSAGLIGYSIGRKGGRPALVSRFAGNRVEQAEAYFDQYGPVTLTIGAFTPIPERYELQPVASGGAWTQTPVVSSRILASSPDHYHRQPK